MSTSTDAILVYGIQLPKDAVDKYDEDADEHIETVLGKMAWSGDVVDGCRVITHCAYSCPMYILCPEGADTWAARGYPAKVESLEVKGDWPGLLRAFCAKHSIEWSAPAWLLCSYWG